MSFVSLYTYLFPSLLFQWCTGDDGTALATFALLGPLDVNITNMFGTSTNTSHYPKFNLTLFIGICVYGDVRVQPLPLHCTLGHNRMNRRRNIMQIDKEFKQTQIKSVGQESGNPTEP